MNNIPDFCFYINKCAGGSIKGDDNPNIILKMVGMATLAWGEVETSLFGYAKVILMATSVAFPEYVELISNDVRKSYYMKSILEKDENRCRSNSDVILYYFGKVGFNKKIQLLKKMVENFPSQKEEYKEYISYFNEISTSLENGAWVRNNIAHGKLCGENTYLLTCIDYASERKKDPWDFTSNFERTINNFLGIEVDFNGKDSNYNYNSTIINRYIKDLHNMNKIINKCLFNKMVRSANG